MINYERIVELPIFPSFLMRTIPLVFFANIERTVRGRATNPAKLSRTPAELFSESGSWLPLSCGRRPMCSPTCEKILQEPVRLPASVQVDRPVDRAETTLEKTSERWLPSHLPTIPVSPIRHNRISIGADLFIHDAGHARQIFSLAKFFPPRPNVLRATL